MSDLNLSLTALFMLSVVSLLVTPGPVTLLVVRAGMAGGMRHAVQTIAGTNAASLVLIAVSALLIKGLLVLDDGVLTAVRALGCAYISWMAWGMLQEARKVPVEGTENPAAAPALAGVGRGFALGISNPKDIVFFAAFFPQFIGVLPSADHSMVLLTGLWVVLDFSVLGLLALLMPKLVGPTLQRRLLRWSALLLLWIGMGGLLHAVYG
ncbi:MAG: LysE family translocator, partial [Comamonadaceae bacterium]|nr:LysE family translocator [Comamonadaceae bacterium]